MATDINFFKEDIRYRLLHREELISWITSTVRKEGFKTGAINIILCSDKYLRKMNKEFLQHDYNTDIITFDLSEDPSIISGDLFISLERVMENAITFETSTTKELHRVMIHGILHLCGYSDKSSGKIKEMRKREDFYLEKRKWAK
jgi:probable rRNA maturation factor